MVTNSTDSFGDVQIKLFVVDPRNKRIYYDERTEWDNCSEQNTLMYNTPTIPMEIDEYRVNKMDFHNDVEEDFKAIKKCSNSKDFNDDKVVATAFQKPRILQINSYKKTDRKKDLKRKFPLKIGLCALFALFPICFMINSHETCANSNVKLYKIREDLLNEMVGQNRSIDVVFENIKSIEKTTFKSKKILPFVGRTGVGKTYLANILKRHYDNVVFEVNKMQLNNIFIKDDLFDNFQTCKTNLLIVDNLFINNVPSVINFVTSLPHDYKILTILIFNTDIMDENLNYNYDIDNVNYIRDNFKTSELDCDIVTFDNVTIDDVKVWMIKEFAKLHTPELTRDDIMDKVIDNHDIKRGFKGIHSKFILEIERYV